MRHEIRASRFSELRDLSGESLRLIHEECGRFTQGCTAAGRKPPLSGESQEIQQGKQGKRG
jgi:hypothetical protein